ncbi:MAG: nucleotide-binding universal stress UspA family protein [Paracoccaceae bacterium]|jgi:nucleotide-binding universal stress UspA family protein
MYNNILIPIVGDVAERTDKALAVVHAIKTDGATVTLLHVTEQIPSFVESYVPQDIRDRGHQDAIDMLVAIEARTADPIKHAVIVGHGGQSIVRFAADHGMDCIVIGSHQPEFQDVLFGSTAAYVVRHASCAVHVLR